LEQMTADLLGREAALYMPSGTMSNQAAIAVHTRPGDEIICESGSHTYRYEVGAPAALSGVLTQLLEGKAGVLAPDVIAPNLHDGADIHQAPTSLIVLENTHNRAGGRVFPLDTMQAVRTLANHHGVKIHLDGARLLNAQVASGVAAAEYAACADTVSLCLSKGLGAPVGSLLSGTAETIAQARRVRKRLGGGMRQVGILAAAGIYALEHNVDRLADDHANAKRLAAGL
ncbi:MAG: low specificity L-threonine aldolase, partial [Methyloversatilis sp.]|nr:low specificity L-threonine aldolase [Methyloversatilis sp.]